MRTPDDDDGHAVPKIAAAVVTYFPDTRFPERLETLLQQIDRLVVVDNGSGASSLGWTVAYGNCRRLTIYRNPSNLGIATALNQAMGLLAAEGFDWVITFDQDSTIAPGFVPAMLKAITSATNANDVAMIGANRKDVGASDSMHRWLRPKKALPLFERVTCDQIGPEGVTLVITSGTAVNVRVFRRLGPFKDEFFIDFVDSEYCLRARRNHYRILVCCKAEILHRVGEKEHKKLLGVPLAPLHHSPVRKYYLFRNGVHVIRTYGGSFPHWLVYQTLALFEVILSLLLFEREKLPKLKACFLGIWDGLQGRTGHVRREF